MLVFFSSHPFYTSNVQLPNSDTPISAAVHADPRFRFFDECIGAVDGTHIRAFAPLEDHTILRNRKGFLSQNCLFVCDLDFYFTYSLTGWDGSVADATLWNDARSHDLRIPQHRYLLADAGFGTCDALLVPYRGVRYHLKEWRQANIA
jgi:DDE superfamily endonuclease